MKKSHHHTMIILVLSLATAMAACTPVAATSVEGAATTVPTITSTPDPCASENLEAEVQKVHSYMREFDDASSLAGSIMQGISNGQMQIGELSNAIPDLQRIRRDAEDQPTPSCLTDLKTSQISHMYAVLNSLNAFIAGNQEAFDQNVIIARQQHDKYVIELARLLGQTMIPISTAIPLSSETEAPTPNP